MTHLRGMVVRLRTENQAWAGTDDHIYIGVFGKGGGREFPLDVGPFNDFERGTDIRYHLGTVWDGTVLPGTKKPKGSEPGGRNNPAWHNVNLDLIDYVYIRKAGSRSNKGDDAYKFDFVEVTPAYMRVSIGSGYNSHSLSFTAKSAFQIPRVNLKPWVVSPC